MPEVKVSHMFISKKISVFAFVSLIIWLFPCVSHTSVISGPFTEIVRVSGTIKAEKSELFIVPRTTSWQNQIKWLVEEGALVQAGDVVVRFDTSNLSGEIENALLDYQDKEEELALAREELQNRDVILALEIRKEEINLAKANLSSQEVEGIISEFEQKRRLLDIKKSQRLLLLAKKNRAFELLQRQNTIKKLQSQMEDLEDQIAKMNRMLDSLILRAKSSGAVVYGEHGWPPRKVQTGDTVRATQRVATIPDLSSLYVEGYVHEADFHRVESNMKVQLSLESFPNTTLSGVIESIHLTAEERELWGEGRYFPVLIRISELPENILRPGMSVRCDIQTRMVENVWLIPMEEVWTDGEDFFIKPFDQSARKITTVLGWTPLYFAIPKEAALEEGLELEKIAYYENADDFR